MSLPGPLPSRRHFLQSATALTAAALGPTTAHSQQPSSTPSLPDPASYVDLPQIHAPTDAPEHAPGPFSAPDKRIGFAIVGLGRLSINQILPAFGKSKYCKPVALVSGSPDKATRIAAQYSIKPSSIYTYANYEQLASNPDVQVIYIVLPNAMHEEFVLRGARTGKQILCEKPMAPTAAACQRMISACAAAGVKLMIAYRQQYEPMNREIVKMVKAGKLGTLRSFIATNTQNEGDPTQWRLNRSLAGGGCLPDVGVYCLNAARFLTDQEPSEVTASIFQPEDDPRFKEVEATCSFTLRFPSGLIASCNSGYAGHRSQFLRLEGTDAWAELSPAFGYTGLKLRHSQLIGEHEVAMEPTIEAKDQFATEMDHMAHCVLTNTQPHTPGEEGLADTRIIEAIYESAHTRRTVKLSPPTTSSRGPEPEKP